MGRTKNARGRDGARVRKKREKRRKLPNSLLQDVADGGQNSTRTAPAEGCPMQAPCTITYRWNPRSSSRGVLLYHMIPKLQCVWEHRSKIARGSIVSPRVNRDSFKVKTPARARHLPFSSCRRACMRQSLCLSRCYHHNNASYNHYFVFRSSE